MRNLPAADSRPEIKIVGKSGQISLGKRYAGKMLRLERLRGGVLILTAVAMVPEGQLWTLQEPDRSRIRRGLEWAAGTPPAETDLNGLVKRRPGKGKRARA